MRRLSVMVLMFLSGVCHYKGEAQSVLEDLSLAGHFLYGEHLSAVQYAPNKRWVLTYSEKKLTVSTTSPFATVFEYESPAETRISSAMFKMNDPSIILIHLSNGTVDGLAYNEKNGWEDVHTIATTGFTSVKKIIGDAIYILNQGRIYASWDTAKTWAVDSVNIGKLTVTDVSIDTNYYGWISTNQGIFYQHPDSNIWRNTALLPGTSQSASYIFVDRRNRIFVSRPGKVFFSTDRGESWNDISDASMESITSFGDDAFGNIYAVGSGSRAYRLSDLTPPWVSIGDSIKAQAYLPSSEKIINSITGDSILYAATKYGMFQSTDVGATWTHSPNGLQISAHNFYTGIVRAGNYYFASTNLGIYRVAAGDTIWEKIFPKQGFIWGVNVLTSDSAGNVYGNLPIKTGPSSWLFYTVKSTDAGITWIPDTAGFKALGINAGTQTYDFFVDWQGVQYLGGSGILYSKKPGQVWKKDSAGIGMKPGEYIADVSLNNKKGITYLARRTGGFPTYLLALYQRSMGDSVWHVVNTSTLTASEGRLVSDADGNIIVRIIGGSYKIWKYDGSSWTEIPIPTGIGTSPWALHLAPARNGVLWGAFVGSNGNKGIYFTTNSGTSWKYVGLEAVGIKFLNTIEDTAYTVTFIDGVHAFTTASEPTSVENTTPQIADSYELYQNYPNPFNPTTTISFSIPNQSLITIKIFDVLGREVATLVNEEKPAGSHTVTFSAEDGNGTKLSSGVYFYRMQAENYTQTKKLLLQK